MQVRPTIRFGTTVESGGDDVRVVGPTHLSSVDCETFSAAGATKVDGDIAARTVSFKGTTNVGGDAKATEFVAEGSTNVSGGVTADEVTAKGSTRVEGDLWSDRLDAKGSSRFETVNADAASVAGALSVADLVADAAEIRGVVDADCIEADDVQIVLGDGESTVEAIRGGTVSVKRENTDGRLHAERVEGEVVSLEHATVDEVTGEKVRLGPGARVGLVRAEELDVDGDATVEKTE